MAPPDSVPAQLRLADLADARVAIWGYGREGRAALALLRRRFPTKSLTLFCSPAEALTLAAEASAVDVVTAAPDAAALAQFDIVIKSPGISPYKPPAPEASQAGVRFTSGTALWFAEHPQARTICVTGTKGKSTVTALIAHILRKGGLRVALAGNIGLPLLDLPDVNQRDVNESAAGQSDREPAPDWWVIELSSFQTRDFDGAPTIAVINNLYEEHLDWHGSRERYVADKLAVGARAARVVVNAQPALLAATASIAQRSLFGSADGWHVAHDAICRGADRVLALSALPLPGLHNAQNVCAALAAIDATGLDAELLAAHAATFKPLPHRLQTLGTRERIDYINDSIATTPYATIEALLSLAGRATTVVIGGFDRGVSWHAFVEHVTRHPPHAIVTMGANGAAIAAALSAIAAPGFALSSAASLADAVARAQALTPPGGTILLSPGAPSFDQFRDYAERGREFARLAGFDPAAIAHIEGMGIA